MKEKNKFYVIFLFLTFETLGLAAYYHSNLGDLQLIIDGGRRLYSGVNPYRNFDFANSPVSGLFIYLISTLVSRNTLHLLLLLLNVTGYMYFYRYCCYQLGIKLSFLIVLLPILSPYRALVSDVQISGLVILLALPALKFENSKPLSYLLRIVSCSFALELKPQIAIPIIILGTWSNKRKFALFTGTNLIAMHSITAFLSGRFYEMDWVKSLFARSEGTLQEGFQVSIWKLSNYLLNQPLFWKSLSFCLYLTILTTIFFSRKIVGEAAVLLIVMAPLMLTYQHLYDLIPILIISIAKISAFELNSATLLGIISIVQFPLDKFQVAIILLTILVISKYLDSSFKEIIMRICVFGLIGLLGISFNDQLPDLQYSYISSLIWISGSLMFISAISKKNVNQDRPALSSPPTNTL